MHPAGVLPGAVLASAILGLAGFATFVPLYALEIGLSGSRLVFGFFSVIVLTIRLFGARIPDLLGARRAGRIALVTNTAGFLVMALWAEPVGLFVGTALFSAGQSLVFPALMSLALGECAGRGARSRRWHLHGIFRPCVRGRRDQLRVGRVTVRLLGGLRRGRSCSSTWFGSPPDGNQAVRATRRPSQSELSWAASALLLGSLSYPWRP